MASQGLSSWLSGSTETPDEENEEKQSTDSPLDISLAQLRAKETITRISPEKRALVEDIDSEADDAEFDERAHWARSGSRKKARASRRAKEDKNQPSIALFCVKEASKELQVEDESEAFAKAIAASQLESLASQPSVLETTEINGQEQEMSSEVISLVTPEKSKSAGDDTPNTLMSSGRPKRQAVVRAEILQQQQKLLDAVAAKNNAASFLTPPPSSKKADANAKTSGRKRKLDMNKKKTSPNTKPGSTSGKSPNTKAAQAFFLSEQEKKQLQEIEAVSSFREQLRQTREKDKAFFDGKAVNPFFQARAMKRSNSVENDDGSVEIGDGEEGDDGQAKQRRSTGGSRWKKTLPLFPDVQLVASTSSEAEEMDINYPALPRKLSPNAADVDVIDVESLPVTSLPAEVMGLLKVAVNGQIATELSFSEHFWFREFVDASSSPVLIVAPTPANVIDVTSPRLVDKAGRATTESETTTETEEQLIEELVEFYGMRESHVRELFAGLEQAKAKHLDREQNLSLVDRYMPVNASGLVGNHEVLRILSSWLSAWKVGGDRRDCFESELITFDDSDSEDEVGDLFRLFILEGESGCGKSAAVYACAEELGYEIIEINAAQNRSGKSIVELAGEATQSTRVLHVGGKDDKGKKKHKKKRRRQSGGGRRSLEKPTAASSSLVLFEDVDLVFEEDKGFLNALCSIAKHSKCPIVVTCAQLPDSFPSAPSRLCRTMHKPSQGEFATWMRLVAFIEGLTVAPSLVDALGNFFERDVRRSLHFLAANLPIADAQTTTHWRWRHVESEEASTPHVDIPAWTLWTTGRSSFDALTSNLLVELSSADTVDQKPEDKTRQEKEADIAAMTDLAHVLDAASLADAWMSPGYGTPTDCEENFFLDERKQLAALELRRSSLYMLEDPSNPLGATLMRAKEAHSPAVVCVQRTLDSALEASRRRAHQDALAVLKPKFELPLAYKGCGNSEPRFTLDYMPMVGRLASSTGLQEGRRRTSRRNHYLGDVLGDMALLDELPSFNTYLQLDEDQIVAASQDSSQ